MLSGYEAEAQVISEAAARAEIRKRGLDEDEVLLELSKRGIDLNKIDLNNPAELSRAETALREVLAELEGKKNTTAIDTTEIPIEELTKEQSQQVAKGSEEITEAIEEGATLEEAVAETLQETQDEDAAVREAGLQMINEMEKQGKKEAGRIVAAAREEIVGIGNKARQEIDAQIADARKTLIAEADKLSLSVMEKVLGRRLMS